MANAKDRNSAPLVEALAAARARGVRRPVVVVFSDQSPQARAAHLDLLGRPLPEGAPGGREVGPAAWAPLDQAQALLRRHAGGGGAEVADRLAEAPLSRDYLLALLMAEGIQYAEVEGEEWVEEDFVPYDVSAARRSLPLDRSLREEGPGAFVVEDGIGPAMRFRGPTRRDARLAATLAALVAAHPGHSESAHHRTGKPIRTRVRDSAKNNYPKDS